MFVYLFLGLVQRYEMCEWNKVLGIHKIVSKCPNVSNFVEEKWLMSWYWDSWFLSLTRFNDNFLLYRITVICIWFLSLCLEARCSHISDDSESLGQHFIAAKYFRCRNCQEKYIYLIQPTSHLQLHSFSSFKTS